MKNSTKLYTKTTNILGRGAWVEIDGVPRVLDAAGNKGVIYLNESGNMRGVNWPRVKPLPITWELAQKVLGKLEHECTDTSIHDTPYGAFSKSLTAQDKWCLDFVPVRYMHELQALIALKSNT